MFLIKSFPVLAAPDFHSYDVVSFDVFDTVLTRNVYRPSDVFLRIQHRLRGMLPDELLHPSFDLFHRSRIHAEKTARRLHRTREDVTLMDIARTFGQLNGVDEQQLLALFEREVAEELRAVSPIMHTIDLIAELHRAGKRIIFLSDMYLPKDVICRLLEKVGAYRDGDLIYVSGEAGFTKATGSLFRHVLKDLGLSPDRMAHVGDYGWSDYLVPLWKHGIQSFYFTGAKQNRDERSWGEGCTCLYCSSIAGASRAARLELGTPAIGTGKTLHTIGCNIVAPILVSFVLWVLQRAVAAGIQRLYFLSRDGEVLFHIARELSGRYGLDTELRYLYVSRTAIFTAQTGLGGVKPDLSWLKEDNVILTTRILAARLKIDPQTLYGALGRAGIPVDSLDAALGVETVEAICEFAAADSDFFTLISASGREAHLVLTRYLEQEGFFDGTPHALVDLGWKGSIQDALLRCCKNRLAGRGLHGYYFGLVRDAEPGNGKEAFLFHPHCDGYYYRYRDLFTIIMETLCAAPHGMVKGYIKDACGTVFPDFYPPESSENLDRIPEIRRGVRAFVGRLDIFPQEFEPSHVRDQVMRLLKRCYLQPTPAEADALGELYFSGDQSGYNARQIAVPFTTATAWTYLTKSSYAERSTISSWFFASWVRSPRIPRFILLPAVIVFRMMYYAPAACASRVMEVVTLYNNLVKLVKKF